MRRRTYAGKGHAAKAAATVGDCWERTEAGLALAILVSGLAGAG